jgi:5,10-methylene-tetrahydrofolate dehydrogenase/methenyl tetrahydrofolate cyclohydrolase
MGFKVVESERKKKRESEWWWWFSIRSLKGKQKKKKREDIVRVEVGKWQFISKMIIIINTSTSIDGEVNIIKEKKFSTTHLDRKKKKNSRFELWTI